MIFFASNFKFKKFLIKLSYFLLDMVSLPRKVIFHFHFCAIFITKTANSLVLFLLGLSAVNSFLNAFLQDIQLLGAANVCKTNSFTGINIYFR